MQIRFNDTDADVAEKATLLDILHERTLAEAKGIAAAVNGEVVPRKDWPSTTLYPHDRILVIKAAQGG